MKKKSSYNVRFKVIIGPKESYSSSIHVEATSEEDAIKLTLAQIPEKMQTAQ